MVGENVMVEEILEIYFKDLKANRQKKLKAWYASHEVTGLEAVYNNEVPIIILTVFDEGDILPAMDHSEEMVT